MSTNQHSMIEPSKAIARFLAANAVAGTVRRDHPQTVSFEMANGRTGVIFLLDDGRLGSTLVYRGQDFLGSSSTLKGLARMGTA